MLVFDQLNKDDPQLRFLATVVLGGMLILLGGLWWIQIVSSRSYQHSLEKQSIRTVPIPPVRGKILDRNGRALAENRPSYNVDLYLEELSKDFQAAFARDLARAKTNLNAQAAQREKQLGRKLTKEERKQFVVNQALRDQIQRQARYEVINYLVGNLSARLQQPINLTQNDFENHYLRARALPMDIVANLNPVQVARFEEQSAAEPGMDLQVLSMRYYPNGTVGAHLLGYLRHKDASDDNEIEDRKFNYWVPDYMGVSGIEGLFDEDLHGSTGEKSILVNYKGYKQSETVWTPSEPGKNVVLTIDLDIQKAAEEALQKAQANVRGAVVVMDAQNGDVLAMASAPNFNPNHRIHPDPATRAVENERWNDPTLGLQRNRAIYENYHPGSIFKVVVGMAGLEVNAFNPKVPFHSDGYYMVGRRRINDTAGAGEFDFDRAMAKSSNPYFCDVGLRPGVLPKIIELGHKLHLGERTGIIPHQEAKGNFPTMERISSDWRDGDTANLSIGQGEIDVTPIQMAVMAAAVANGGKVFWPRVVMRIENADGTGAVMPYPQGRIRDYLGVSPRTLRIVHEGMLSDTEDPEGTGHLLKIPGWRVAGKTGTAEVENRNGKKDRSLKDTWFLSFAPEESPRYVVVATVEGGASGGKTCVPIVREVYQALQQREQQPRQQQQQQKRNATRSETMAVVR